MASVDSLAISPRRLQSSPDGGTLWLARFGIQKAIRNACWLSHAMSRSISEARRVCAKHTCRSRGAKSVGDRFFENSAIGVALTDLSRRFLATNPVYQKMVGHSEEELQALSFLDITDADYRDANGALIAELLEGNRQQFQVEKQYRRKDGSLFWVRNNVSLVPDTGSGPPLIMALCEDIMERKGAEEALQKNEERVRLILDFCRGGHLWLRSRRYLPFL